MATFLLLATANIVLMLAILRRYSLFSSEGLCMVTTLVAVLSDHVMLLICYVFDFDSLRAGYAELSLRTGPTVTHLVGLVALAAGLYLANPRPWPVVRDRTNHPEDTATIRHTGMFLTACGTVMYVIALVLVQAPQSDNFYSQLDLYRTEELSQGGFWYRGSDIAAFGLALIFVTSLMTVSGRLLTIGAIAFIMFFLTSNKGGPEKAVIWGVLVSGVYDRSFFRRFVNPLTIALLIPLLFVTTGLKNLLVGRSLERATYADVKDGSIGAIASRFSHEGLYRGYCSLVTYLNDEPGYHDTFQAGSYTFAGSVPRVLYPNKPDHPFRKRGFIMNPDKRNPDREVAAPLMVGYGYADAGYRSLVPYLFAGGLFLGWLRRALTYRGINVQLHVCYVFFVSFSGLSAEAGFLNTVYMFVFIAALMTCNAVFLAFMGGPGQSSKVRSATAERQVRHPSRPTPPSFSRTLTS